MVKPSDFRAIVRRGRRSSSASMLVYRVEREETAPARFGFIVAKTVGNAVERNLVRRRMRSVCRSFVDDGHSGSDVVVRALPGSAQRSGVVLASELHTLLESALTR